VETDSYAVGPGNLMKGLRVKKDKVEFPGWLIELTDPQVGKSKSLTLSIIQIVTTNCLKICVAPKCDGRKGNAQLWKTFLRPFGPSYRSNIRTWQWDN